jgi:hypothetical protein
MIDGRRAPVTVAACAVGSVLAVSAANSGSPASNGVLEAHMTNHHEETIRETTQPTISGHHVGVGNIWERDLPDAAGIVAPHMSATLSIFDPSSGKSRHEKVFVGSVITLGADRYLVVSVEEGEIAPGAITLRKLVP